MWILDQLKSTEPKEVNLKEVKKQKKAAKAINKGVEKFTEKKSDSYWKDVEHNTNAWCSIREDSRKAKAYRDQWNWIYKYMWELEKENENK